ncbi:hypothetical protein PFISCL1PPCAC_13645, partial [Pristionchus fissidentatus]
TNTVAKSFNNAATPLIAYTTQLSTTSFTPLQKELLDETLSKARSFRMLGAPEVLEMGKLMIALNQTKKALDIGTFTAASALAWAIAVPADGKVVSMDVDHTELNRIGIPVLNKAPELKAKIDFRLGSAIDTLKSLIANGEAGTYGFAFIDADKVNYCNYYELCLTLLCPGGVIMVDNALWSGSVVNPENESSIAIDKLNRFAAADDRVHNTLLNVGDGIHLIVKKH